MKFKPVCVLIAATMLSFVLAPRSSMAEVPEVPPARGAEGESEARNRGEGRKARIRAEERRIRRLREKQGLRKAGLVLLLGGGYLGLAKGDGGYEPGSWLGAGPSMFLFVGWQTRSKNNSGVYRAGGGYLGTLHPYRQESGSVWASRISFYVDVMYRWTRFSTGLRVALGLGLADLGRAYERAQGKSRGLTGLFVQLGFIAEYLLPINIYVGFDLSAVVDGAVSLSQSGSSKNATFASLGYVTLLYAAYRF